MADRGTLELPTPVDVSETVVTTAAKSGIAVARYGFGVVNRLRPGYVAPKVVDRQALLRNFRGRIAVAPSIMDPVDFASESELEDELRPRVSATAAEFVERGHIDEGTAVEVRTVLPPSSLLDKDTNQQRKIAVGMMGETLESDYGMNVATQTHPMMPPESGDATATWGIIAEEMDGARHQLGDDAAMIAMTSHEDMGRFFGNQVAAPQKQLAAESSGKIALLETVGKKPEDNVLGLASEFATVRFALTSPPRTSAEIEAIIAREEEHSAMRPDLG